MSSITKAQTERPVEFRTVNVRHRWLDLHTAAVSAHGEIDAANAERFGDYVLGLVPHCKFLVVDLSGLKFLGTQGVSALHRIRPSSPTPRG